MMTLLVTITAVGVVVGSAVTARHRAQSAADLAALAAAGHVGSGEKAACTSAVAVAAAMQARISECTVDGLDVVVAVEVAVDLGRWGLGSARGAARAGPAR